MSGNKVDPYREEMWGVISRSWREQAARRQRVRAARTWGGAGLGLAATLVAGILVGRWSTGVDTDDRPATAIIADTITIERPLSTPYRIALGEHFKDAETLLVLFDTSEETDAELIDRARELAAASRMLMTSRVGRDAEVRSMLLELELLLVQISRLVDDQDATETRIVRDSVENAGVLGRLQRMISEDAGAIGI